LAVAGIGLQGDRHKTRNGKRQVTLIQFEHVRATSSILKKDVNPQQLRRNIVVEGINLLSLKGHRFKIGEVICEYSGECHPCSRMEEALGPGGYNAMRGHGGITAKIISGGVVHVGDPVVALSAEF
jgi:MOSC domain-containing protein YiiM